MKNERRVMQALLLLMVVLTTTVFNFNVAKVKADGEILRINPSQLCLMEGGNYQLEVVNTVYDWSEIKSVNWYSSNPNVANVDANGVVTAYQQGNTWITYSEEIISYDGSTFTLTANCNITVIPSNYTIDIHEKEILRGETFSVSVPNGVPYNYTIQSADYYDCIDVAQDVTTGKLNITALASGNVELVVNFLDINGNIIATDSCKITVLDKGINPESMACALGTSGKIEVNGYTKEQIVNFSSADSSIAMVDMTGVVTPVKEGITQISVTVREKDGSIITYTCKVSVSDPKLTVTSGNLAIGCTQQIEMTGLQPDSQIILTSSKTSIASINSDNSIYAVKKGNSTITCIVDGRKLSYKLTVTDPKLKAQLIPIVKGKSSKIKLSGTNAKSVVTYQSLSESIATVSKSGTIKAKKIGSTGIQITVDGKVLKVAVSVSNKKIVNMIKYSMNAIGSPYSQAKRMQKGYYDCSSLTWRSYHSAGVDIGSKFWAPTAADLAHTLVKQKKAIAYKELPISKLKPGDLLFFTKTDGTNNGRYKNIYHVAIYVGSYGNDSGVGLLMEARLAGINLFEYGSFDTRKVAVIARPLK